MLICYGQTMEHNRVDTVGNQIMNEIQIIDITELTLFAPISVSMYRHDWIIELTVMDMAEIKMSPNYGHNIFIDIIDS